MFNKLFWTPIFLIFAMIGAVTTVVVNAVVLLLGIALMPTIFLIAVLADPKEDKSHYEKEK